ncbi:MAG TPA: DMT family transporter [Burkholderiaceae bacterium]
MPASALALVVVAALLHAFWNIVAKKTGGNRHFVLMGGLLLALIWAPAGLWLGWRQVPAWGATQWAFVAASGVLHLAYFKVLLKGYRVSDLTVVYPVARGTGPLISSLLAVAVMGEALTLRGALGVLAVCAGVFVIAGGPAMLRAAHDPAQRARAHAGLVWGGATGVLIAGYTVLDSYSVKALLLSPVILDYFGNLVRLPFMLPTLLRDPAGFADAWRRYKWHAVVLGAVSPLAYILVLYAVRLAPVSHVAPAREISMLFAALIGGRLLGEGDRGQRVLGALLMAAGVVLLAL